MMQIDETTAIVTGGAQGIGSAISKRLAQDGARVLILDIQDASETVKAIREQGGEARAKETDVTDEKSLKKALDGVSLGILVNNAAYYAPLAGEENKKRFDKIPLEEWETVLDVNTTGVYLTCKHAMEGFKSGGSIINISSGTIHTGTPGYMHYVASKAAITGITRVLSEELGEREIRANAITPGLTASEATLSGGEDVIDSVVNHQPLERRIQPEHIADTVSFLASPDSCMMTGQVLNVDGGARKY